MSFVIDCQITCLLTVYLLTFLSVTFCLSNPSAPLRSNQKRHPAIITSIAGHALIEFLYYAQHPADCKL